MPPEALARQPELRPVRVIAVTGGKGGTGKTCVSVNLAAALAQAGHAVLLLDGDLGLANVDVLLGLAPRYTLEHVISGERKLDEVLVEARAGFKVIPAASGVARMAQLGCCDNHALIGAFQNMDSQPDVLIIDTAPGLADSVLSFTQAAQEVLVVLRNEPASLTDAYGLIKVLNRDYQVQRFRVVVNQVHSQDEGATVFKRLQNVTDRYLRLTLELAGVIPADPQMIKAVRAQRTLVEAYPDCVASRAIRQLATSVGDWPPPVGPSGRIEFYLERVLAGTRPKPELRVIK